MKVYANFSKKLNETEKQIIEFSQYIVFVQNGLIVNYLSGIALFYEMN